MNKRKICIHISWNQAFRILHQPKQPFQAKLLHPARRSSHRSRMEIKACPYAQHDAMQHSGMCSHPFFLFWSSQSNPDKIRFCIIDLFYNCLVLFFCQRSKRWGIHPDNVQLRILFMQSLFQRMQCIFRTAIKIVPVSLFLGKLENSRHQIRSRNTSRLLMSAHPTYNRQGFPIRKIHCTAVLHFPVFCITKCHDRRMHIGNTDIFSTQLIQVLIHIINCLIHRNDIDVCSQQFTEFQFFIHTVRSFSALFLKFPQYLFQAVLRLLRSGLLLRSYPSSIPQLQ